VADVYGPRSVGVVLTGANEDGSRGLRRIADRGGLAIVQDPETAESHLMPASALKAVPEALVLSVEGIADHLATLEARTSRFGSRA
jgi:two-component system, chemotaxis family, protein-glutamate methylesterase/glutaminase